MRLSAASIEEIEALRNAVLHSFADRFPDAELDMRIVIDKEAWRAGVECIRRTIEAERDGVIEECALVVENGQETITESRSGSQRHITPRKTGKMKLEPGKQYANRLGEITTPLIANSDGTFSGKLSRKWFRWATDGTFGFGRDSDSVLINEATTHTNKKET